MIPTRYSAIGAVLSLLALAACNSAAPAAPVVSSPPPVAAVPEPLPAGVVGASVGRELDDRDRAAAIAAQNDAVNAGRPKSWRGSKTAYGVVTPGPESGDCRDYVHKIYINGRPQEAKGQACRKGDVWRVVS